MTDYSVAVATSATPGKIVAALTTKVDGTATAPTSITATWKDPSGVTISSLTRTSADVSGADTYGNTDTLAAGSGTGAFNATLLLDSTHYGFSTLQVVRLDVTFISGGVTWANPPFYFQVVPYNLTASVDTQAIAISVMRQVGFYKEVPAVAKDTSSTIPLGSSIIYGIAAAYKNGVAMTVTTDYTWKTYQSNVQLVTPPAVNDHFLFIVQVKSDAGLMDIVNRYTREAISKLQHFYDTDDLLSSPDVAEFIKTMCIGEIRRESVLTGNAMESSVYRTGVDLVKDTRILIDQVRMGSAEIYDSSGVALTRTDGSIVGGVLHADGEFINRLGLQDRAQQFTGEYLAMFPDPIISQTRGTFTA